MFCDLPPNHGSLGGDVRGIVVPCGPHGHADVKPNLLHALVKKLECCARGRSGEVRIHGNNNQLGDSAISDFFEDPPDARLAVAHGQEHVPSRRQERLQGSRLLLRQSQQGRAVSGPDTFIEFGGLRGAPSGDESAQQRVHPSEPSRQPNDIWITEEFTQILAHSAYVGR